MTRVFINPGHSLLPPKDPGAVNDEYGVTEAALVRSIGEMTAEYLKKAGCEVMLLQSNNLNGEDSTNINVCRSANLWPADIFVSIHCNSFTDNEVCGTETLVYNKWSKGYDLASCIQRQICDSLHTLDRGVKVRPELIVLKGTIMPSVLVETAFISNPQDVELLINKSDEFARAIARGITDFLQK